MRGKTGTACTLIILLVWGLTGPHFYVGLDKSGYHPGEEPVLRTCNIGLTPISFGEGYHLYRLENGTLAPVRTGLIFLRYSTGSCPFSPGSRKSV